MLIITNNIILKKVKHMAQFIITLNHNETLQLRNISNVPGLSTYSVFPLALEKIQYDQHTYRCCKEHCKGSYIRIISCLYCRSMRCTSFCYRSRCIICCSRMLYNRLMCISVGDDRFRCLPILHLGCCTISVDAQGIIFTWAVVPFPLTLRV